MASADTLEVPSEYATIQAAIDVAQHGDTVLVADGVYTGPGNKWISFLGKAITVRSSGGAEACVIDCEGSGRAFEFMSTETPAAVLSGFTIRRGGVSGGAMIIMGSSSPTVRDCVFSQHEEGAVRIFGSGDSLLAHCRFSRNGNAGALGGAIAIEGGGQRTLQSCTFEYNQGWIGGAVYGYSRSAQYLLDCLFVRNDALWGGGAFFAEFFGEATHVITNCTFVENNARDIGGGFSLCSQANALVENCIFWGNTSALGPQAASFSCKTLAPGDIGVSFSDVEGGRSGIYVQAGGSLLWGPGNFDLDPLFVNPVGLDFHLSDASPCIDIGDPAHVPRPGETDIDGEPRRFGGGVVDVGADEVAFVGVAKPAGP